MASRHPVWVRLPPSYRTFDAEAEALAFPETAERVLAAGTVPVGLQASPKFAFADMERVRARPSREPRATLGYPHRRELPAPFRRRLRAQSFISAASGACVRLGR